jgi:hypothetical protein
LESRALSVVLNAFFAQFCIALSPMRPDAPIKCRENCIRHRLNIDSHPNGKSALSVTFDRVGRVWLPQRLRGTKPRSSSRSGESERSCGVVAFHVEAMLINGRIAKKGKRKYQNSFRTPDAIGRDVKILLSLTS